MARDWFDYIDKLAVPIVLAVLGTIYTAHKDDQDRRRATAEQTANATRLAFDRDAAFIRLLASDEPRERDLGASVITALTKAKEFSPELLPVAASFASGAPSDPKTQVANTVVATYPTLAAPVARDTPIPVFIQIARDDQRAAAEKLQVELRQAGFSTPGIEQVANGTTNTYVRFFANDNGSAAGKIQQLMIADGYTVTTQDFVNPVKPLRALEIWIGSKSTVSAG